MEMEDDLGRFVFVRQSIQFKGMFLGFCQSKSRFHSNL